MGLFDIAEWSPDGSRLVLVRGRLEGVLPCDEIYVKQPDGSSQLSFSPSRLQALSPDWSPYGRFVWIAIR